MNVNDLGTPVATLDLSTVRTRLMHPRAGLGWSAARTSAAESAYREFLLLAKLSPRERAVPSADVDYFWHFHILDTQRYAADCETLFGYFLHHEPDVTFDAKQAAADARAGHNERNGYCARIAPSAARAAALGDAGAPAGTAAAGRSYCASPARPQAYCASPAMLAPPRHGRAAQAGTAA